MSKAPTETIEQIDSPIKSPFIEHLGIQFFRLGASGVEVRLPVTPELLNSAAMVHGGVYATLASVFQAAYAFRARSSVNTVCVFWLACASTALPACCRMLLRAWAAVSAA